MPVLKDIGSLEHSSDDSVSVNSTAPSEPREEYPLEGILAERKSGGTTKYLVKWDGYPDVRCTWESDSNFQNDSTLSDWTHQKMRIARGLERPYDVDALERRIEVWLEKKNVRKNRRRAKRLRLGLPVGPEESYEQDPYDDSLSEAEQDDYMVLDSPPRARARLIRDRGYHLPGFDVEDDSEEDTPQKRPSKTSTRDNWTANEIDALMDGLKRTGGPHWGQILGLYGSGGSIDESLKTRNQDQLKDKARSLKTSFLKSGKKPPMYLQNVIGEPKTREVTKTWKQQPVQQIDEGEDDSGSAKTSSTNDSLMDSLQAKHENKMQRTTQPHTRRRGAAISKNHTVGRQAKDFSEPQTLGKNTSIFKPGPGAKQAAMDAENIVPRPLKPQNSQMGGAGRGPSRIGYKSAPSAAKPGVSGAAVLGNWAANLRPRKRMQPHSVVTISSGKKSETFNKLSIKRKFEKAGRNEPAPNPEHLTFVDLKGGHAIKEPSIYQPKSFAPSRTPFQMIQDNLANETIDEFDGRTSEPEILWSISSDGLPINVDAEEANAFDGGPDLISNEARTIDVAQREEIGPNIISHPPQSAPLGPRQGVPRKASIPFRAYLHSDASHGEIVPPGQAPEPYGRSQRSASQLIPRLDARNILDYSDVFGTILVGLEYQKVGDVRFRGLSKPAKSTLLSIKVPPNKVHMWFQQICTAEDYNIYFHDANSYYGAGYVVPFDTTKASVSAMAETLRMHNSGGLFFTQNFTMLIYPNGAHTWHFVNELQLPQPPDSPPPALRFLMRTPAPEVLANAVQSSSLDFRPSNMDGEGGANALFRQLFGIEYAKLIPQSAMRRNEDPNTFYLMYPMSHKDEHDVLVRFLEVNNATIYSSQTSGAWDYFTSCIDAGVVLIHNSFYLFHLIPSLTRILRKPINIFALTLTPTPPEPHLVRLFPHGAGILLSDSMVIGHPHEVVRILRWFHACVMVTKAAGTWKLVMRPKVRGWLLKIIEERDLEDGKVFVEVYAMIYRLLPLDLMDEDDFFETPKEGAPVVCSREIGGFDLNVGVRSQDSDPEKIARNDGILVEWFAGWARTKVEWHRKFQVISASIDGFEEERRTWARRWSFIEIMTPEQCFKSHRIVDWEAKEKHKAEDRKLTKERKASSASEQGFR